MYGKYPTLPGPQKMRKPEIGTFCTSQQPATAIPVFSLSQFCSLSSRLGSTPAAWPGPALPHAGGLAQPGSQARPCVCRSLSHLFPLFHFPLLAALAAAQRHARPAQPGPALCLQEPIHFPTLAVFSLPARKWRNKTMLWDSFLTSMQTCQ